MATALSMLFFILLAVFVLIVGAFSIKIIFPYEKGVVERLGRYIRTADPGLTIIVPFIDKMRKIDMREQVVDIQPQEVITRDNVVVTVDAVVFYEATDPVKLVYNVADFFEAATKLAQTNLRNVIGEMELDEALTSREVINTKLREVLDDATDKWGVRVVRVEIKRIDPPADVTEAMHRQMKAEREKRANILEAEGFRHAKILEAEGLRQSKILEAEGEAEAVRRIADAQRYKLETEAQGQAVAVQRVFDAIKEAKPDDKLIAIQYLEALKVVADGQATKLYLPYEASGILGALGGIGELFQDKAGGGANPAD
ncbi:MAG TPA: SPFH/Band 7/PHB domain protein [Anaerolineae bacterium]|nr:SPFH/Band 7/PHB domain protein [Anaerolineae bacterium]